MHAQPLRSGSTVSCLRRLRFIPIILLCGCVLLAVSCSSVPQDSHEVRALRRSLITLQAALPAPIVGQDYNSALTATGASTPYFFWVTAGQLPQGLSLNSTTGVISGTPVQAGQLAFTVSVRGGDDGFGARTYTMSVGSCGSCVTVQISPLNPSIAAGTKLQFTASVTNTSNTAVTWSASAGTITPAGLFTAPANISSPVTITVTSTAQSSAQARTTLSFSNNQLTITSSSLPSASVGAAYDGQLAATGGKTPYNWSIPAGTLPQGLQLGSNSGAITGAATQKGSFNLTIKVSDSAQHTAEQNFVLQVSSAQTVCGPPNYCSRTDTAIVQMPSSVPKVGNLVGANTLVTDPDFSNRIVRITDVNTDPALPEDFKTFVSSAGGSADENLFNLDSSLFMLQSIGTWAYPYTFNTSTMQAARMYVSGNSSTGGMRLSAGGMWSRVDPNIFYSNSGTQILKYDFTNRSTAPSPQTFYDFTSSPRCLPAGFNQTWEDNGGASAGDATFGMTFSNSGYQGTGIFVAVYRVGSGCTMLNTQTGQVTGDWGSQGKINIPDRWTIHNARITRDGNWFIIVPSSCTSATCSTEPYFWQIGTTNVTSCGDGGHCGGHWTEGYTHWINDNTNMNQTMRPLVNVANTTDLTPYLPDGIVTPLDQHQSWNNADPADTLPLFATTWSTVKPFPTAYYNEIVGYTANGSGKIWRFAHNFISGQSQFFSTQYGIGSVSQDGRFFIFSSDWMGTLGSTSGGTSCTIGVDCRGDVFILQLN